jgi:hypothetical protein
MHEIRAKLNELKLRDREHAVFGARAPHGHRYQCKPILLDSEICALEASFGVELPSELREFLAIVHGGGAGPGYGFFLEPDRSLLSRRARDFPFDHAMARNVITQRLAGGSTRWKTISAPDDGAEEDDEYPPGTGFLPIAHQGCGVFDVIVAAGEQRGFIWWYDMAWGPWYNREGAQMGLADWYEHWLDSALRSCLQP